MIPRLPNFRESRPPLWIGGLVLLMLAAPLAATPDTNLFHGGIESYRAGNFDAAARDFRAAVAVRPSSGALHNLGNTEWLRGRAGEAVLAWEQALWLNPFESKSRNNLRYARELAQMEPPELAWHEVASGWLPNPWWAWFAGLSLWLAVGSLTLPGVLRWRRRAWQQAVAAVGFGVFLLCIPTHLGTLTRARIGFVLPKETALRLTPTREGEMVSQVNAGEPVRRIRVRGNYVFVQTPRASGWIETGQVGWLSGE